MKLVLVSFGIGLLLVVGYFILAVIIIQSSNFDPTFAYYAQLPLRLPYFIDQQFIPPDVSRTIMPNAIAASLYVYLTNAITVAIPVYLALRLIKRSPRIQTTNPPPPPEFEE